MSCRCALRPSTLDRVCCRGSQLRACRWLAADRLRAGTCCRVQTSLPLAGGLRCSPISLAGSQGIRGHTRTRKREVRKGVRFWPRVPLIVADVAPLRLLEHLVDYLEQFRVVLRQLLARVDVVVDAADGGVAVEVGLDALGPVFLVIRRRVGLLPQALVDG